MSCWFFPLFLLSFIQLGDSEGGQIGPKHSTLELPIPTRVIGCKTIRLEEKTEKTRGR